MSDMFRAFGLIMLIVAAPVLAQAPSEAQVDAVIGNLMRTRNIVGAAVAVSRDGNTLLARGYGDAKRGSEPARPDTIFFLDSTTKQYTAAGIMLLVQDGRIGLDDPVRKYLPGAPASWNPIRIRHLLTHTSGLAHDPPHYAPMPDQNCHPEVMLEPLFRMSPRTPIGLLVHHNGGGFGFGTAIYRYVDARLTVIVLTNTVWPNAPLPRNNGDAIAHAVAALYEPRLARPAN